MKIALHNTTNWSDKALMVILRWVAKQTDRKTNFRINVRNRWGWSFSYSGNRITVSISRRHSQRFPFEYRDRNLSVTFESRLQILVWSAAWCLYTDCDRYDRFYLATKVLVQFKQQSPVLRRKIIEVLTKQKVQKPPKKCLRYSAALHHLVNWEKRLKLAQTKVKKYKAIAARYERQFEKEAR